MHSPTDEEIEGGARVLAEKWLEHEPPNTWTHMPYWRDAFRAAIAAYERVKAKRNEA